MIDKLTGDEVAALVMMCSKLLVDEHCRRWDFTWGVLDAMLKKKLVTIDGSRVSLNHFAAKDIVKIIDVELSKRTPEGIQEIWMIS